MARRLGVGRPAYSEWERNVSTPGLAAVVRIRRELGEAPDVPPVVLGTLGGRLRAWRLAHGVTSAVAAKMIGVDLKTLYNVSKDRHASAQMRARIEALIGRSGVGLETAKSNFEIAAE